jgi:hypothetical protein
MPSTDRLLDDDRVIGRTKRYTVVFGPFSDTPNPEAEVIFVGLTPGRSQLKLATRIAREQPNATPSERAIALRREVAFAGRMRRNLIAMLDALRLPQYLGVASTAVLFETQTHRIFTTSALRYPVFISGWKNYSGNADIVREPLFLEMLETLLAPMLSAMPTAFVVPLGKWACAGVMHLADRGLVDTAHVLRGFPHPSGANGHRVRMFEENKQDLMRQLRLWFTSKRLPTPARGSDGPGIGAMLRVDLPLSELRPDLRDLYEEFRDRFRASTDQELIDAFNREVDKAGWVSARGAYLAALQDEFTARGFDFSAIGSQRALSLRRKIRLVKVVEPL